MRFWILRHVFGRLTPLQLAKVGEFMFDLLLSIVAVLLALVITQSVRAGLIMVGLCTVVLVVEHVFRRDKVTTHFYRDWNQNLFLGLENDEVAREAADPDFTMKAMVFNGKLSHTKIRDIVATGEWVQRTAALDDYELAHALDDAPPEVANLLRDFLRDSS